MKKMLYIVLMFLSSVTYAAPFEYYESHQKGDSQNFMVLSGDAPNSYFQIYTFEEFSSAEILSRYVFVNVKIEFDNGRIMKYNNVPFLLTDDIRGMIVGNVPSDDHYAANEEEERYARTVHQMIRQMMNTRQGRIHLEIRSENGRKYITFPCGN